MVKWFGETMLSFYFLILVLLIGMGMDLLKFPFWSFLLVSIFLFVLTIFTTFKEKFYHKRAFGLVGIGFYFFVHSMLLDYTHLPNWACLFIPFGLLLVLGLVRFIWWSYNGRKDGSDWERNVTFF